MAVNEIYPCSLIRRYTDLARLGNNSSYRWFAKELFDPALKRRSDFKELVEWIGSINDYFNLQFCNKDIKKITSYSLLFFYIILIFSYIIVSSLVISKSRSIFLALLRSALGLFCFYWSFKIIIIDEFVVFNNYSKRVHTYSIKAMFHVTSKLCFFSLIIWFSYASFYPDAQIRHHKSKAKFGFLVFSLLLSFWVHCFLLCD